MNGYRKIIKNRVVSEIGWSWNRVQSPEIFCIELDLSWTYWHWYLDLSQIWGLNTVLDLAECATVMAFRNA